MGGNSSIDSTSARNGLQDFWDAYSANEELRHKAVQDPSLSIQVHTGGLDNRIIRLSLYNPFGEAPLLGQSARDFIKERLQVLFRNASAGEIEDRVNSFLEEGMSILDRHIEVVNEPAKMTVLPTTEKHDVIAELNRADVRSVSADTLAEKIALVRNLGKQTGVKTDSIVTALKTARQLNRTLGAKTGREIAASWQATANEDLAHPSEPGECFVEETVDANMNAADAITKLIGAIRDRVPQGQELPAATENALAELDQLADGLSHYANDIVRLAEDMREIAESTQDQDDREITASGFDQANRANQKLLDQTFARFTQAQDADAKAVADIKQRLDKISTTVATLGADSAQPADELAAGLFNAIKSLEKDLTALKGGNGAIKRELLKTLRDTHRALFQLTRHFKTNAQHAETPHLREPSVLMAVFHGRFETDFYLKCRKQGIPAEMIDPAFSEAHYAGSVNLDKGASNTVKTAWFTKIGCYDERQDVIFKSARSADEIYRPDDSDVRIFRGYNSEDYSAAKINFATYKIASKWLGAGDRVVSAFAGYQGENFGFCMSKAPGRTLRTKPSQLQRMKGQQQSDLKITADQIKSASESQQVSIATQLMLQGNDLDWCDYLTGQSDRHLGNLMLDLGLTADGAQVTLTGIDNDVSFSPNRIGLNRFRFRRQDIDRLLTGINRSRSRANREARMNAIPGRPLHLPYPKTKLTLDDLKGAIREDDKKPGYVILDRELVPAAHQWMFDLCGIKNARKPSFITEETLAKLHRIHQDIERGEDPFQRDFGDCLPAEALEAMRLRFDELYAHACALENDKNKKVVSRQAFMKPESDTIARDNLRKLVNFTRAQKPKLPETLKRTLDFYWHDLGYVVLDLMKFFDGDQHTVGSKL